MTLNFVQKNRLRYALFSALFGIACGLPTFFEAEGEIGKSLLLLLPALAYSPALRIWMALDFYPKHKTSVKIAYDALCRLLPFEAAFWTVLALSDTLTPIYAVLYTLFSVFVAFLCAAAHRLAQNSYGALLKPKLLFILLYSFVFAEILNLAFYRMALAHLFYARAPEHLHYIVRMFFCILSLINHTRKIKQGDNPRFVLFMAAVLSPIFFFLSTL